MKRYSVMAAMAAVLSLSAPAEAAFKGCYERVYDKAYLRKHPKQLVIKMRLQIGVSTSADDPLELKDRIDAGIRATKIYKGNRVACTETDEGLHCKIEDDGGSFTVIDRGENSIRITNEKTMQFGDIENGTNLAAKGDHREFRLYRISEGTCP